MHSTVSPPSLVWISIGLACVLLAGATAPAPAAAAPFEWQIATPESQGMSSQRLDALKDRLASNQTKVFLVVRNDKIVCEWYAPGFSAGKPHYTASMAKALVGGVSVAVALSDGRIALDDKAAAYVPSWRDDPRKSQITIRQLGSHASGIEDAEQDDIPHDKLPGWKGLFWKAAAPPNDPFSLSRDKALVVYEPGKDTRYSNPGIAMLAYCVTVALKDAPQKDLRTLLRDRVMQPLGVPDDQWSVGYRKTFTVDGLPLVAAWGGGSYTARAVARVGRLMLRGGNWEGKQLILAGAVRQVTSDVGTPGNGGIGWWSNNQGRCPKLPQDAFWGLGAGHQAVVVVPSLKLIAVRNGATMRPASDWDGALYDGLLVPLIEAINEK
jgi:CubicO group peptidase (beta-lactamase class C family)